MNMDMYTMWKLAVSTVILVLSTCCLWTNAFVAPIGFARPTASLVVGRHHERLKCNVVHDRVHHSGRRVGANPASGSTRGSRPLEPAIIAESSNSAKHAYTVGAAIAIVAVAGSTAVPLPALAETQTISEVISGGLINAFDGPIILAVPIVLGIVLATSVAAFIYYFSQPREYDE